MEQFEEQLTFNQFREILKDTLTGIHNGAKLDMNRVALINSHAGNFANAGDWMDDELISLYS